MKKKLVLKVVIAEMKEEEMSNVKEKTKNDNMVEGNIEDLGIKVSTITEDIRLRQNIPDEIYGLMVTNVGQNTDAERKGIRPGDIIQEIDRIPVRKIKDLQKIVKDVKEKRKGVLLLINRQGNIIFTAVKFSD